MCSPECANGGTCVSPQQCSCLLGWTGDGCHTRECAHYSMFNPCGQLVTPPSPPPAVCSPDCGNGGTCVGPNNCSCLTGWTGDTCSQGAWGVCAMVARVGVYRSFFPHPAATCSPPCQNGGYCVSPDVCVCSHTWAGTDCSHRKLQ